MVTPDKQLLHCEGFETLGTQVALGRGPRRVIRHSGFEEKHASSDMCSSSCAPRVADLPCRLESMAPAFYPGTDLALRAKTPTSHHAIGQMTLSPAKSGVGEVLFEEGWIVVNSELPIPNVADLREFP